MEDNNTLYAIIAVLAAIFIFLGRYSKSKSKKRKSRKFMDNYKRKDD